MRKRKPPTKPNGNGTGRDTIRTDETRDKILQLVMEGHSLRQICEREDMPNRSSVTLWLAQDDSFSAQYARAWNLSADSDFDEMYEIVNDGSKDFLPITDDQGRIVGYEQNKVKVQRDRLKFDQRRWAASKKAPKKYGEKLDLTVGGNGKPITSIKSDATPEEAAQAYHDAIQGDKG